MTIIRDKSGFKNKFYPKYFIVFSENLTHHILYAKKKPGSKSSNISISLDNKDFKKNSKNLLGKLRSNFVGTQFKLFSAGENPKKRKN